MRAGRFVQQPTGYVAFEPTPLPPDPPVPIEGELARLLSAADVALGRLDGITGILPNPDLFVAMYVKQEAVLSSQIEGTQASLTDVLQFEAGEHDDGKLRDVREVVNYVGAMNYGLEQTSLPLSLRLIREIHSRLMQGVRGEHLEPGEFRRTQNWIGPAGCTLTTATFVPPPPHQLFQIMGDFERFLHDEMLPPLIHAGLAHAQFETIHPFLDGNGRVGRLLITFLLCNRGVLSRPLLYLSHFLKQNRIEYYDRLQAVRTHGAWKEWLSFFLRGVRDVATEAHATSRKILDLYGHFQELLKSEGKAGAALLRTLDVLFAHPVLTTATLATKLDVSYVTANGYMARLRELGVLREMTGFKRNRRFAFSPYLALFESAAPPVSKPSVHWIDPAKINVDVGRRSALTPEQIARIEALQKIFGEFGDSTLEKWLDDFERESNPEREISIWEAMAQAYVRYCSSRPLAPEARRDVFGLVLARSGASDEEVLQQIKLQHLSQEEAREVLRCYLAPPQPIRVIVR
ncbi:Fic family protein [Sorangium sp. So ce375]|uniref:Fic family protein n=1 Tax=Sorangium sp. So ce375 TaxID=3133306 RepID=UPI003F5C699D